MIKKRYQHPMIELCRDCEGTGIVYIFPEWDIFKQTEPEACTCSLCEGSGRVQVSKQIIITINPFKIP